MTPSASGHATLPVACPEGDWSRAYTRCSLFGAALVGTEVYDSNICPHGPQGCLHVVRDATAQQNRETEYAQSGMTSRDVIFGGNYAESRIMRSGRGQLGPGCRPSLGEGCVSSMAYFA
jgi:hypothetical protein